MSLAGETECWLPTNITETPAAFEDWLFGLKERAEDEARSSRREFYSDCLRRIEDSLLDSVFAHAPLARTELTAARDKFQDLLLPAKVITSGSCNSVVQVLPSVAEANCEGRNYEAVVTVPGIVNAGQSTGTRVRLEIIQDLKSEFRSINEDWRHLSNRILDTCLRPDLFRLRALYCRLVSSYLHVNSIGDLELSTDVGGLLYEVRDFCRHTPQGNPHYLFPDTVNEIADPDVWKTLAYHFERTSEADEAFMEIQSVIDDVDDVGLGHVLDRIGAVQQLLYRRLENFDLCDRLQSEFYSDVRSILSNCGIYSPSLKDTTANEQLESLAAQLKAETERVIRRAVRVRDDRIKAEAKRAALDELIAFSSAFGLDAATGGDAATRILELVRQCQAVNIPDSTLELRKALIHYVDCLPESDKSFAKLRAYIIADRKKAGLDLADVAPAYDEVDIVDDDDDPEDDQGRLELQRMIDSLLPRTRGLKALIIGGTPRQNNRERLKEMLEFAEVDWPGSNASDKPAKFETAIRKAQLVISLKAFSRKGHVALVRKLARGHCVVLPLNAGFGPNRVVRCMFEQMIKDESGIRANGTVPSEAI